MTDPGRLIAGDAGLGLPRYERVRRHLADLIRTGGLEVGAPLPSARSLAATWGVDATTVTRAYARLAAEGLVEPVEGTRRWLVSRPAARASATAVDGGADICRVHEWDTEPGMGSGRSHVGR